MKKSGKFLQLCVYFFFCFFTYLLSFWQPQYLSSFQALPKVKHFSWLIFLQTDFSLWVQLTYLLWDFSFWCAQDANIYKLSSLQLTVKEKGTQVFFRSLHLKKQLIKCMFSHQTLLYFIWALLCHFLSLEFHVFFYTPDHICEI